MSSGEVTGGRGMEWRFAGSRIVEDGLKMRFEGMFGAVLTRTSEDGGPMMVGWR